MFSQKDLEQWQSWSGEGAKKKDHCKSSGPYGRNVGDAKIILLRTLR